MLKKGEGDGIIKTKRAAHKTDGIKNLTGRRECE